MNNKVLPYQGFVELQVSLDNEDMTNTILVPSLVTKEKVQYPILGTYAIEHLSKNYQANQFVDVLQECIPDKSDDVIESLVNCIHAERPQ